MEQASSGLQRLLANLLRDLPVEEAVVRAWPLACGASVAEKTSAIDFADGILRVEVPDAQWRGQLREFAAQYVAALNACVGRPVKRVTFVLAGEIESAAQKLAALQESGEVVQPEKRAGRDWMLPRPRLKLQPKPKPKF